MGPEISTAVAIVAMIDKMGGWSIGGLLVFFALVPPIFIYLAARIVGKGLRGLEVQMAINEKESAQRFLTFEAKYDNNIRFVESFDRLTNGLDDTLRRNTIIMTKLVERIDTVKGFK